MRPARQAFSATGYFLSWTLRLPGIDGLHRLLGCLDEPEQLKILGADRSGIGQGLPVDDAFPKGPTEQQEGHPLHATGLDQRQGFEQFVQCPEPAGKHANCPGAHQEVHLADRKIVEIERQLGRDIGIRSLFMRQDDVQTDRDPTRIKRTKVPGLHHTRPSPRANDKFVVAAGDRALRHLPRETARLFVKVRQIRKGPGPCGAPRVRRRNARAPEQHDGRKYPVFVQQHLEFQQLQLQAYRPQLVTA